MDGDQLSGAHETDGDLVVETNEQVVFDPSRDRRGSGGDSDVPVHELLEVLNSAFAVEVERKRAELAGLPTIPEPDAGVRFARGLLVAGGIGVAVWGAILVAVLSFT